MSTRRLLPLAGIAMVLLGQLAVAGTATVYYYKPYKNWASANVHSNASGNWTAVPGTAMTLACTNWYSKALTTGAATTFQATFTNGAGQWDNVDNVPGYNYVIPNTGTHQIKNGQLLANIGSPCGTDATAPTAPSGLKTTAIAATSVTLAWTAAADNFSVAGYDIYRGTTKVGTATTTSYTNTGLTASTTYSYTVKARDAAGKISAASTALSVKTTPSTTDSTAPAKPSGLVKTAAAAKSITLKWNAATDNFTVKGYDVYRGTTKVAAAVPATTYLDVGLAPATTYNYSVKAVDNAGNTSAASTTLAAATVAAAGNISTVYYKPATTWTTTNIHYGINGTWTAVPGVLMDAAACAGWKVKAVDLGTATSFQVVFNNGSGTWDNNNGANYTLGIGAVQVNGGVITSGNPCAGTDTTAPTVPSGLTLGTTTENSVALSWTASTDAVGVAAYDVYRNGTMVGSTASTSYNDTGLSASTTYSYTVKARDAAGNTSAASAALAGTTLTASASKQVAVYYYTTTKGWATTYIHYSLGGTWTTPPGVLMNETACTGWALKTIDTGALTSIIATFNNGSGTWDNNNSANYTLNAGIVTVKDGVVTNNAAAPCVVVAPDTTAPSVPTNPTATATNTNIALSWTASTDAIGVTGYTITRTGGTQGTVTLTAGSNSYTDSGLTAQTTYTYTIKAFDAAGNVSASSSSASAKTSDAAVVANGTPLGTDMREESVYFVMTARFYDGDTSNNRGGALNTKSGNAANNDPMFRGDFKGLTQKLDYIKALGFSAIWITPVTLNRSDYDYHGYHTFDFNKIDGRLESAGATYQDLINAAHAKGIKIIQDIVINHSSRWGAKGLFVPTVFGVRDSQWSWYYDVLNPSFTYDGVSIEPNSGKNYYNGDHWSNAVPAGNTCNNWGVPTGSKSAEGYTVYNCQWPSPTSGMFPSKYFHQCWIGNWEGEDARSCWIHEDLADFNTENAEVQQYLLNAYYKYIDMGVDGFRIDTAVHVPRVTWNRRFLPQLMARSTSSFGSKGQNFYMVGEVGAFVNDKWNRGSVNHSAQFFTWKERQTYTSDDVQAALDQFNYENNQGTGNQPTTTNAFLSGNAYHTPDHSKFSGMNVIDMRMHMNFGDAGNAFYNGKDSDDSYNDATYNMVYVDSHDFGPNKSSTAYAGGTAAWAENMSLMWTFRGIPTLYQGSEIEFQAGKQIDCGPTCPLATTRRAYFGTNLDGSVTASDFGVVASASGTVATTLNNNLVKHVQRLNQIRRKIPALQKGQYSTEGVSGNIAYKRRFTSSSVDSFALVSVSGGATFSGIPNGTYTDAVTGDVKTVTGGSLTSTVSGQGNARIYVLSTALTAAPGKIGVDGPFLKP